MDCVYYGSPRVIKYGTRGSVQRYRCKECGKQFNERSGTPFAGMKYRPQEVVLAPRLRFNYRLSCREVSELMAEIGHPISESTILFWTGRFHDSFQTLQRRYRPEYSRIWHVDELHVRLRSGKAYIHIVEDENRCIIAITLSERRDKEAAARALRKARVEAGFTPDILVSDGSPAYPLAIEEIMPETGMSPLSKEHPSAMETDRSR